MEATGWEKNSISSDGLMYLLYVCVPGATRRRTFSAAKMVRRYANGVLEMVDKNK